MSDTHSFIELTQSTWVNGSLLSLIIVFQEDHQ